MEARALGAFPSLESGGSCGMFDVFDTQLSCSKHDVTFFPRAAFGMGKLSTGQVMYEVAAT